MIRPLAVISLLAAVAASGQYVQPAHVEGSCNLTLSTSQGTLSSFSQAQFYNGLGFPSSSYMEGDHRIDQGTTSIDRLQWGVQDGYYAGTRTDTWQWSLCYGARNNGTAYPAGVGNPGVPGGPWNGTQQCAPEYVPPPPSSGPPTTCHTCGGATEPLALDLDGDGVITTTGLSAPVFFDLDADGEKEWITRLEPAGGDGFLWLDVHPNHQVDSGLELFGVGMTLPSGQKASSGFEALAVYDTPEMGGNDDGQITVADQVWGRLRLWIDANGDGLAQAHSEIFTLAQRGIRSISLQYAIGDEIDANGNNHYFRAVFTQSWRDQERVLPIHGLIFQRADTPAL